jgi:hypothetical protein
VHGGADDYRRGGAALKKETAKMFEGILAGLITRYAIAMTGSATAAIAGFMIAHWGVSATTAATFAGGIVSAGWALVSAVSKNSSVAKVIGRFPIDAVLHAVASKSVVNRIEVGDRNLADSVPSPKVVAGPRPEGPGLGASV